MLRPVEISAPDGLVCTAVAPAPVGSATVEAVWTVSNVVSAAINRLLLATPKYAHRAQAVNSGTMATFNLSGRDRHDKVFGLHLMDPLAAASVPSPTTTDRTPQVRSTRPARPSPTSRSTNRRIRSSTTTGDSPRTPAVPAVDAGGE